tara:strand:+ start:100 stop:603 length:504 start_codon:yes stop_codon:yes gene_type:complete
MRTTKKEVSTTGGVAGYNTPIGAAGNPTPEEIKRWKKEKRKLLDKGKKKRAKPFVKDEQKNIDERAHQMIRDTIFDILLEQGVGEERMNYVIRLFEGLSKNLNTSLAYARMFILDSLKMDVVTGGVDLNAKRAKTELNHVRKLVNDLDTLIEKIYMLNRHKADSHDA